MPSSCSPIHLELLEFRLLMSAAKLSAPVSSANLYPATLIYDFHQTSSSSQQSGTQNIGGVERTLMSQESNSIIESLSTFPDGSQDRSHRSVGADGSVQLDSISTSGNYTLNFKFAELRLPPTLSKTDPTFSCTTSFKGERSEVGQTTGGVPTFFAVPISGTAQETTTLLGDKTITVPAGKFHAQEFQEVDYLYGTLIGYDSGGQKKSYTFEMDTTDIYWASPLGDTLKREVSQKLVVGSDTTWGTLNAVLLSAKHG